MSEERLSTDRFQTERITGLVERYEGALFVEEDYEIEGEAVTRKTDITFNDDGSVTIMQSDQTSEYVTLVGPVAQRLCEELDTTDDTPTEKTAEEEWEAHNEDFNYEPPEGPAESWSSAEYTELHDRLIGRRTQWYCQKCSTSPFSSLEKARRHVQNQHGDHLYQKYGGQDV